jgi:hypothetical protein
MNKKPYTAPIVKKVRLEVKNAVLAVCHTSPQNVRKLGLAGCNVTINCYTAPHP